MRIDFQNTAISQVGAGDHFSMALSEDGKQVYVWGVFVPLGLDNIVYPTECKEVSEWLQAHGTSIKKMRVSGHAVAFQTTDGGLFVWGDNKYGQLANNHMRGILDS